MKTYELTYIITPEITSEEAVAKAKEIESLIISKEGSVLKQSAPSARALSHPVGKHASGFFGIFEFNLEPEKLPEVESAIQKDGKISRHMIIIKKAAEFKKERRTKAKPEQSVEKIEEPENIIEKPVSAKASPGKEKVELKDIEQKLDEILGE